VTLTSGILSRDKLLAAAATLEPLPASVTRLAALSPGDDDILDEIISAVSLDPVLTAEVLRFANSAFARRSREIATVEAAVVRLGATAVVMERFDPVVALRSIERSSVTHSQWVPTMFVRMLRLPEAKRNGFDLSSHRVAIHGAAPCPRPIKEAMLEWWGPIIHEYYGASEGGGVTHIGPDEWLQHRGSVGKPLYGVPHILDEEGSGELPAGETGVVYFERGIPIEYHNDKAKTLSAHGPNGWSTVGDLGYLDDDGYLYLVDRRSNLIISGGVNIYPREVEDVLVLHPAVFDAAVIGVSNEEFGQEVKAVVQVSDGHQPSEALETQLIEYCRSTLASYKCPRTVDFVQELPRSENGKLYKRHLVDMYAHNDPTSLRA